MYNVYEYKAPLIPGATPDAKCGAAAFCAPRPGCTTLQAPQDKDVAAKKKAAASKKNAAVAKNNLGSN